MDVELSEVLNDEPKQLTDLNFGCGLSVDKSPIETTAAKSSEDRLIQLPLARVRNIMKIDPDVPLLSQEGVFAITKATEMFVEQLTIETYNYTIKQKKKTIQKKDVDNAIDNVDALCFLEGAMNF